MRKEKLYRVVFDTQRDRRYITWGCFVMAYNQMDAKDKAFSLWNSTENPHYRASSAGRPHMFHTDASKMADGDLDHDMWHFFKIEDRFASWGRR